MKFKDMYGKWKFIIIFEILIVCMLSIILGALIYYMHERRIESAEKRAEVQKSDDERIGERFILERDEKEDIILNLYYPKNETEEEVPVIFNIHGGGFTYGDVDELDSQSDNWSKNWNVMVVAINYTTLDLKPMKYAVEEILDTIKYFKNNADEYHIDVDNMFILGHSAGGHYAAQTAIEAANQNVKLKGQILCSPWTSGLPEEVSENLPPALFILGGDDEISRLSSDYQERLANVGVEVTAYEYENGLHSFIYTLYPELKKSTPLDSIEVVYDEEQQKIAKEAENDIHEWILKMLDL